MHESALIVGAEGEGSPSRGNKSPLSNKPLKSTGVRETWGEGDAAAGRMIKGSSVWLYIYSVYTRDKSTITETQCSLIFITVLNERNSEFTFREKKKRSREEKQSSCGGRAVKPSRSVQVEPRVVLQKFNMYLCTSVYFKEMAVSN